MHFNKRDRSLKNSVIDKPPQLFIGGPFGVFVCHQIIFKVFSDIWILTDIFLVMIVRIMQLNLIYHLGILFNNDMHVLSYRNIWERPKTKIVMFAYLRCMIELTWNFCIITIRSRILSTNTNKVGNKQLTLLVYFWR